MSGAVQLEPRPRRDTRRPNDLDRHAQDDLGRMRALDHLTPPTRLVDLWRSILAGGLVDAAGVGGSIHGERPNKIAHQHAIAAARVGTRDFREVYLHAGLDPVAVMERLSSLEQVCKVGLALTRYSTGKRASWWSVR
jgi:hypothetical protein